MDANRKILVVEDERPLLAAITAKLTKSGFDVVSARTVDEALHFLEDGVRVDVVWLDHYLLGKETGLDFLVKIKQNQAWKNIPIFVVSNTAGPDKVQAYIQLGIQKFYTKADSRLDGIIGDIRLALSKGSE